MDSRITDAKEAELFAGELLHRPKSDLKLVFAKQILTRLQLDGQNLPLVARLQFRPKPLVLPLAFGVESMNMIAPQHVTISLSIL